MVFGILSIEVTAYRFIPFEAFKFPGTVNYIAINLSKQ